MIAQKLIKKSELIFNTSEIINKTDIVTLEKKCRNYLHDSNIKLDKLLGAFNELIKEIGKLLATDLPLNDDVKLLNKGINSVITINYVEPISLFIANVYKYEDYRKSIRKGNDDFFLNVKPKDIAKKHGNIVTQNTDYASKIFQFKMYWNNLSNDTKLTLKTIVVTLLDITEKYIEIKDDSNEIANILVKLNKF